MYVTRARALFDSITLTAAAHLTEMNDTVALLIAWMRPRRVAMDTRGHVHFTCIISLLIPTALHDGRDHALQTEL